MADADACGYGAGQVSLGSFHIMGSARMGGSPVNSVCDPTGQTWEVRDRYVFEWLIVSDRLGRQPADLESGDRALGARGLAARLS